MEEEESILKEVEESATDGKVTEEQQMAVIDVSMDHQKRIQDLREMKRKQGAPPQNMMSALTKYVKSMHEQHETLLMYKDLEEDDKTSEEKNNDGN